jgi:hypothetical protein
VSPLIFLREFGDRLFSQGQAFQYNVPPVRIKFREMEMRSNEERMRYTRTLNTGVRLM